MSPEPYPATRPPGRVFCWRRMSSPDFEILTAEAFQRYRARLVARARGRVQDDAEDVVQDVLLGYLRIARTREITDPMRYLFGAVIRRSAWVHSRTRKALPLLMDFGYDALDGVDERLDHEARVEQVSRYAEWDYLLGIAKLDRNTTTNERVRSYRARQKLRRQLGVTT